MKFILSLLIFSLLASVVNAQTAMVSGLVMDRNAPVSYASVVLAGTGFGTKTDSTGNFGIKNIPVGNYTLRVSCIGFDDYEKIISLKKNEGMTLNITLTPSNKMLSDVIVTGVSKAMRIKENPVAVVSVSQKAIEQTISENTIDAISQNAPGLQTVKTGPNVSKPFINGLGYNRVLTLYDGVLRVETQQWGDEHGVPMDDYAIDHAEVIEGPSSLMYGSDAIAGVLSMFVALPKEKDKKIHGRVLSEYQTNNGLNGNSLIFNYGGPHWSYALRGSERIAKNYTNSVDGRVYNTGFRMQNFSAFAGYKSAKGYSHFNLTSSWPWAVVFERVDNIPRHPAQLYESLCYLIIFFVLMHLYKKYRSTEGLLFGWFLLLVFTCRFLLEFVKENQEPFEQNMLINMGQLLSIPFIIAGLVLIIYRTRLKYLH